MGYGLVIALALSLLFAYLLYRLMKAITPLLLNGFFGLSVFWLFNIFQVMSVPLDLVTFLVAAIGGVFGVFLVLALTFAGVPL